MWETSTSLESSTAQIHHVASLFLCYLRQTHHFPCFCIIRGRGAGIFADRTYAPCSISFCCWAVRRKRMSNRCTADQFVPSSDPAVAMAASRRTKREHACGRAGTMPFDATATTTDMEGHGRHPVIQGLLLFNDGNIQNLEFMHILKKNVLLSFSSVLDYPLSLFTSWIEIWCNA